MDAEGGRAIRRSSRVKRLAVVVAVQNLLVVTCLLVTLYLYLEAPALQPKNQPTYIKFEVHTVFRRDTLLELKTSSRNSLQNNNGNVTISCTGPYVWHMEGCYQNMDMTPTVSGNLTLLVKHRPVGSISMNATQDVACRRLYSIVYLVADDVARFNFSSDGGFQMLNVSMGLSYLLGNRCEY